MSCLQALYTASQSHARDLEAQLTAQTLKSSQLKIELAAAQTHISELSAFLKSSIRPGTVPSVSSVRSPGTHQSSASSPVGVRSPVAEALSREPSALEAISRLRSQELQGEIRII